MKVIFLQNIKNVARIGDIKEVSDGYARNMLFPKKLAKPASEGSVKQAEELKKKKQEMSVAEKETALKIAKELDGLTLELEMDANEEGHLYGSIKPNDIIKAFKKKGMSISGDQISIEKNIKTIGEHTIELELHSEVKIPVKIKVSAKK